MIAFHFIKQERLISSLFCKILGWSILIQSFAKFIMGDILADGAILGSPNFIGYELYYLFNVTCGMFTSQRVILPKNRHNNASECGGLPVPPLPDSAQQINSVQHSLAIRGVGAMANIHRRGK